MYRTEKPSKRKNILKQLFIVVVFLILVETVLFVKLMVIDNKKQYINPKNYKAKNEEEIFEQVLADLSEVTKEAVSEDGTIPFDDSILEANTRCVIEFAEELVDIGAIKGYARETSGYSVTFTMLDNAYLLYQPPIEGTLSGGNDDFHVLTCKTTNLANRLVFGLFNNIGDFSQWITSTEDYGSGGQVAKAYISSKVPDYSYDHDGALDDSLSPSSEIEDIINFFQNLDSNRDRLIFWEGHGGVLTLENGEEVVVLVTGKHIAFKYGKIIKNAEGEKTLNQNLLTTKYTQYKTDIDAHRLVWVTTGVYSVRLGITPEFINEYAADMDGGAFICDSCEGAKNNTMAQAFLNKGFQSYVGADDLVNGAYAESVIAALGYYLTTKEDNSECYLTILDALNLALRKVDEGLIILKTSARFGSYNNPDKDPFRLLPPTGIKGVLNISNKFDRKKIKFILSGNHNSSDLTVDAEAKFNKIGLNPDEPYSLHVVRDGEIIYSLDIGKLQKYITNDLGEINIPSEVVISGTVLSEDTNEPIENAHILINGVEGVTDRSGFYKITVKLAGTYSISCTAKDFEDYVDKISMIKNTDTFKEIKMKRIVENQPIAGETNNNESSQEKETPETTEITNFINERLLGTWYTDGGLPTPDRYVIYPDYIEVYGKTFDSDYKLYNTCSYECIKTDYGYYIKLEGGWGYRYEFEYPDCLTYIGKGDPYSNDGYSGSSSLSKMDW